MSEVTFDDYAYHAWSTSFYLDEINEAKQRAILFYGFNEEVNELLTDDVNPHELTSMLWGRTVDSVTAQKLSIDKTSEAGDILFFIAAISNVRRISLTTIMREGAERYGGQSVDNDIKTFEQFDKQLAGHMAAEVPVDYRPDYAKWKIWDFAPFENSLDIVLREPTYAKGPLSLIGDGRYALERLHNNLGQYFLPEHVSENDFISSAGLAVGGLSIVLQHRFNSSLTAAVENNINKRERRALSGNLRNGNDHERSRSIDSERSKLELNEASEINLSNSILPE